MPYKCIRKMKILITKNIHLSFPLLFIKTIIENKLYKQAIEERIIEFFWVNKNAESLLAIISNNKK